MFPVVKEPCPILQYFSQDSPCEVVMCLLTITWRCHYAHLYAITANSFSVPLSAVIAVKLEKELSSQMQRWGRGYARCKMKHFPHLATLTSHSIHISRNVSVSGYAGLDFCFVHSVCLPLTDRGMTLQILQFKLQ